MLTKQSQLRQFGWQEQLKSLDLGDFALYDENINPRLWNPKAGILILLPFRIPSPDFLFCAVDIYDEIDCTASDLQTLIDHYKPEVINDDLEEF
jgi:hypothetical protein